MREPYGSRTPVPFAGSTPERCPRGGSRGFGVVGIAEPQGFPRQASVHDAAPKSERVEVQRSDEHDRLETVEFFVGQVNVATVGVGGWVDELWIAPTHPHQPSDVRQARTAPG